MVERAVLSIFGGIMFVKASHVIWNFGRTGGSINLWGEKWFLKRGVFVWYPGRMCGFIIFRGETVCW